MCSATRRTSCMPSATASSKACCRSRAVAAGCSATRSCRCRSPSTAASRRARRRRRRARSRGAAARAAARRRASRAAQRRARGTRTGRRRISTSRSARRCCRTPRPTCWRFRASSARWCARASSTGSRATIDAASDRFFALYADNVHRHGTPALPRALLRDAAAGVRRRLRSADGRRRRTARRCPAC